MTKTGDGNEKVNLEILSWLINIFLWPLLTKTMVNSKENLTTSLRQKQESFLPMSRWRANGWIQIRQWIEVSTKRTRNGRWAWTLPLNDKTEIQVVSLSPDIVYICVCKTIHLPIQHFQEMLTFLWGYLIGLWSTHTGVNVQFTWCDSAE